MEGPEEQAGLLNSSLVQSHHVLKFTEDEGHGTTYNFSFFKVVQAHRMVYHISSWMAWTCRPTYTTQRVQSPVCEPEAPVRQAGAPTLEPSITQKFSWWARCAWVSLSVLPSCVSQCCCFFLACPSRSFGRCWEVFFSGIPSRRWYGKYAGGILYTPSYVVSPLVFREGLRVADDRTETKPLSANRAHRLVLAVPVPAEVLICCTPASS